MVKKKNIIVYSGNGCIACSVLKKFLKALKIKYIERDVWKDERAKQELTALGYQTIPVIVINGEAVVGFQREQIAELLGISEQIGIKPRPKPANETP